MDRGIWVTWYDLPEDGRESYFSWLHQSYIPGMLKRPGFLWGAHYAEVEKRSGLRLPRIRTIHPCRRAAAICCYSAPRMPMCQPVAPSDRAYSIVAGDMVSCV